MGCDIHPMLEVKRDGAWGPAIQLDIDRYYSTFAYLFGVRGVGEEGLVGHRGLPEDVAPATQEEYRDWRGDAHGESWITASELTQVDTDKIGGQFAQVFQLMQVLAIPCGTENVRLVVWFDN